MGIAVLITLLGTSLVFVGAALFFPDTPRVPILSKGDWPLLITMYLGAAWALLGTTQFLRFGRGFMLKSVLVILSLISVGGSGLISFWVLGMSYDVPAPAEFSPDKPVPAFELVDQNGKTVSDISLRGKTTILIFGRGVW